MNSKIMPMKYPVITSYPYHANLLSIISDNEDVLPWIYNNYIQLEIPDDMHNMRLDFYAPFLWKSCPFIYYQRVSRDIINNNWKDISEFIINCIDNGNYVYFLANYFFIPVSRFYKRRHFLHDIFIYGYDLDEGVFYVADFFKDGKYSFEKVDIQSLINAYINIESTNTHDWLNGVELISLKSQYIFRFNPEKIKDSIKDYLTSYNTSKRFSIPSEHYKHCWIYGAKIYDKLSYYCKLLSEDKIYFDIRPFHVLYDHKVLMGSRIKYLEENNYLSNELELSIKFKNIELKMQILRNQIIKARLKNDKNSYLQISNELMDIKKDEIALLKELEENINVNNLILEENVAENALVYASSLSLNKNMQPQNIVDQDVDLVYVSDNNPSFPAYITFVWDEHQTFNTIKLITRFSQSIGITQFDIQVSEDGVSNWKTVASSKEIQYAHDDYTLETNTLKFNTVYNSKGCRLKINKANIAWERFEVNWLGIYMS